MRPAPNSTCRAALQRTYGKRVPQIVQTRAVPRHRRDASRVHQPIEGISHGQVVKRPATLIDEHRILI